MKTAIISVALIFSAAASAFAVDCARRDAELRAAFSAKYRVERLRVAVFRVRAGLTPAESAEFKDLSARFNAIAHDTPEHIDDRIAMQTRARMIVRGATARVGYRINNPVVSPFDAEIGDHGAGDDYAGYMIEVRSLLVLADPHPHVTLWTNRQDDAHNPWHVATVGVAADPKDDYVTWYAGARRVLGNVNQFIAAQRLPGCR